MKLKNNKGLTLISLVIAVLIMLIITGAVIYNAKNQVKMKKLDALYIDIEQITAKIDEYYLSYGSLPVLCDYLKQEDLIRLLEKNATENDATIIYDNVVNPNDDGNEYYVIDLGKLDGITLTYGCDADYENVKTKGRLSSASNIDVVEDEIYIINGITHQIYYPHGIVMDKALYYAYDLSSEVGTQPYEVDYFDIAIDTNPGDITKDSEGNSLSGTESSPYQICSIEDLIAFSDIVNAGQITSTDTYVELAQTLNFEFTKSYIDSRRTTLTTTLLDGSTQTHTYSISIMSDLTSGAGFTPIGGFEGTFDGKGNTLNNLYINYVEDTNDYTFVGLFTANYGIIQNLNVGGNVTGTMKSTYEATGKYDISLLTGAIAGANGGSINNCNSKATVTGIEAGGVYNILWTAGIVGVNIGNISNSSNSGSITNKSNNQTYLYSDSFVGGITAYNENSGSIENCVNSGEISSENIYVGYTGGIVGVNADEATISKCYNTGNITANNIVNFIGIGGIVGENRTDVNNCYNIGTISTTNSNGVLKGGIIAYNSFEGSVANNYDGTNIGAIGGQDFIGVGESAILTVSSIVDYINAGTHPDSKTPTYAIDNKLTPGSYVAYDTSSLENYKIPQSLSGTASCTESQIVTPSQYTGGWQVLSNDGNKVEIISSDLVDLENPHGEPVETKNLYLSGEAGYKNAVKKLNTSLATKNLYLSGETGYKNAVKTLNASANAFVNSTYAKSARCVGSTTSSIETVADTLKYKPTNYNQLTDMEFYKDYANMCYSGTVMTNTNGIPTNNEYWLASRYCECIYFRCKFFERYMNSWGICERLR